MAALKKKKNLLNHMPVIFNLIYLLLRHFSQHDIIAQLFALIGPHCQIFTFYTNHSKFKCQKHINLFHFVVLHSLLPQKHNCKETKHLLVRGLFVSAQSKTLHATWHLLELPSQRDMGVTNTNNNVNAKKLQGTFFVKQLKCFYF